jgi:hypothetical protein
MGSARWSLIPIFGLKATIVRRDNLKRTIIDFKEQLTTARVKLAEASHD